MISIRLDHEKVATGYDVLMDGYPWFAGVHFWHEALQLAVALGKDNPNAVVEVRKIYTHTQWIRVGECQGRPLCFTSDKGDNHD